MVVAAALGLPARTFFAGALVAAVFVAAFFTGAALVLALVVVALAVGFLAGATGFLLVAAAVVFVFEGGLEF